VLAILGENFFNLNSLSNNSFHWHVLDDVEKATATSSIFLKFQLCAVWVYNIPVKQEPTHIATKREGSKLTLASGKLIVNPCGRLSPSCDHGHDRRSSSMSAIPAMSAAPRCG
jgi:hypothetical protein